MGNCIRCGMVAHQYGSDGLPYCDGCAFYGLNKQCNKCRMYIPASEMQQYQGQWICPVCLNDSKSEQRRHDEESHKPRVEQEIVKEECERCGRDLTVVYFYKDQKLCEFCASVERDDQGNLPNSMSVFRIGNKKKKGIFGRIADVVRGKPKEKDERKAFIEVVRENEKNKRQKPEIISVGKRITDLDEEKIKALGEDGVPGEKTEQKSEEKKYSQEVEDKKPEPKPFIKKEEEARFTPLTDKQKTKKEIFASFKSPKGEDYAIEKPKARCPKDLGNEKGQKKKRTPKKS